MTKNKTPTPVYLDPGMHPGLEVKGLISGRHTALNQLLMDSVQLVWITAYGTSNISVEPG